jgi:NAD(P)-dependent dehydrogenase (short-subunit alcohol dehydrogenase family)
MGLLEGKAVLITGAASGIGRAAALTFAREGARVAIADRNEEGGKSTAEQICQRGGEAFAITIDVGDQPQVMAMISEVVAKFGRLDCAFNNAGIVTKSTAFADLGDDEWTAHLAVNLTGVRLCMKHEILAMRARGGGVIINTSSGAGLKGIPMAGGYVAAKHGVIGITRTAALDHARDGIRVNAICPGYIQTPMTDWVVHDGRELDVSSLCPIGRVGQPEDVAEAALWLASDRASFITGIALPVDGGFSAM